MITEDYVSFETAKLLKEKGFQQFQNNSGYFTTEMVYSINADENGEHHFSHQYPAGVYYKDKCIAAPTLQMAMKWLREVHKLHCDIDPSEGDWKPNIIELDNWSCVDDGGIPICNTYEEACESAIKYCLKIKLILNEVD